MTQKTNKTFDSGTWQKGTRGLLGPWATALPRIENLRFASDGSLIPRPRFDEKYDLIGRTNLGAILFPCQYYQVSPGVYQDGYFVGDSTSTDFYQSGVGSAVATGAGLTNVSPITTVSQIGGVYWLVGQNLVSLSSATIGVTDVATALDARFHAGADTLTIEGSAVHQGRAFYWGPLYNGSTLVNANRMYYSDAYDYGTFTSADQFFDVDSTIAGAASAGANLFIWTVTGDWFVLQGRGNPAEGTLNANGKGRIPAQRRSVARQDNSLYFMASDKTTMVRVTEGGFVDDISINHIGFNGSGEKYGIFNNGSPSPTASSLYNSLYVPNDDDGSEVAAVHQLNQVWTEEENGPEIGDTTLTTNVLGSSETEGVEMLARYTGGNWKIYTRNIAADGPEPSTATETVTGTLGLPRVWDARSTVRVNRVIIDARYWKGDGLGGSVGPYVDPAIAGNIADGKGNTVTLFFGPDADEISGVPEGENVPIRIVGHPQSDGLAPFTHFADVTFTGLSSLAIERVTVEYETSNARNF